MLIAGQFSAYQRENSKKTRGRLRGVSRAFHHTSFLPSPP